MVIEELFALLGFKVEGEANLGRFSKGLDNVGNKITGLARNITKFGAVAAGAFSAVGFGMLKLAGDAAKPLDDLVKSADRAGVSFEALQRMGFAAEQSGSSTQELASNLETVTARLAEAARGSGRAREVLKAYGISATDAKGKVKDANVFFLELADHMQGMSEAESLDLAQKLGISRGLLTMLRSGRDAIEAQGDIAEQAGLVFSEQNARDAEKYNDTLNLFTKSLTALKTAIGVDLLPSMTSVIERMQEWLNANRQFIRSTIGEVIGRLSDHMTTLVRVMANLEPGPMVILAGAVALIASSWVRFAAFVVAVEDLVNYLGGGESYFGMFVQWIQDTIGVSQGAAETIGGIGAAIVALGLLKPSLIFKPLLMGIAALAPKIVTAMGLAFVGLATPAGWGVILAGVAAAAVAYFWDDFVILWNALDFVALGKGIATGILNGLVSMAGAIADWFNSIIPPWAIPFVMSGAGGRTGEVGPNAGRSMTEAFSQQPAAAAAAQMRAGATTQNNNINIEQTFNGSTTTSEQVRAGTRAGALDAIRSLGTTAPSPAQ